jgi:drug/metabolite transporter (DMT)-like permease
MIRLELNFVGETAALATSCLWTITSLFFTSAGKKIGSLSVNAYRTVIAVGFLAVAHVIFLGTVVPFASVAQWFWMGASGIVGLVIGDGGLFAAFVTIGPRRAVLVMALAPIFAIFGAYLMLGELLPQLALVGVAVTLTGVIIVVLESEEPSGEIAVSKRLKASGLLFALIGAAGQGIGLVLSKKGIDLIPGTTLNPLSATLMRLILAASSIWLVLLIAGKWPHLRVAIKSKEGISNVTIGVFLGIFLGITFSMVAVTYTQTGVAQTLMSLMPVLIIPTLWIRYRQRTSRRGMLGAAVAVIGVAILFLS